MSTVGVSTSTDPSAATPVRAVTARHLLSVADLTLEELLVVLDPDLPSTRLPGSYVVDIPAWRTHLRTAVDEAISHAGGRIITTEWPTLWTDRARPLGGEVRPPVRAALIGTEHHRDLDRYCRTAAVPIINATSDDHQPLHVLADLLTIRELFGHLRGLRVAFVGGPDAYRHSLIEAAVRTGIELTVATGRDDLRIEQEFDDNRAVAGLFGGGLHLVDPSRQVVQVDVVIGDPVSFGLIATSTHLPLHLTGAAADSGASLVEGPRELLFHRQENLQNVIRRVIQIALTPLPPH